MFPVRDALRPGVPGHSQAGCRGAGPPGMAGLRVHSSCPGRRGAGREAYDLLFGSIKLIMLVVCIEDKYN